MQAQCMTWLFAYFDMSWIVHGGPRSQVPCLGTDAMEGVVGGLGALRIRF